MSKHSGKWDPEDWLYLIRGIVRMAFFWLFVGAIFLGWAVHK